VPHTLGLRHSITPVAGEVTLPGRKKDLVHATGWSGDGSPGTGSLREFAIGAVRQHFPKTLAREEGVDFRLPTDRELDALEAFQLSLGRSEEIDLAVMTFADPTAELGKQLFNNDDGHGNPLTNRACAECHENAGANNVDGRNQMINAGAGMVTPDEEAGLDGGFGFPDQALMNTPSLIEAADTAPFFHNNVAPTLEDATRFYTTDVFAESVSGKDGGRSSSPKTISSRSASSCGPRTRSRTSGAASPWRPTFSAHLEETGFRRSSRIQRTPSSC
jgi:hypothetical protein